MKHTDELIADQAKQIHILQRICKKYLQNVSTVKKMLYCIGGPLNDNKHQYNGAQLQIFFRILEELEMTEAFEDEE